MSKDLENGYDIQAFTYDYSKCPSYTIDWYYHNNGVIIQLKERYARKIIQKGSHIFLVESN